MASRVMGSRRSKAFPVMKTATFTVDRTVVPDLGLGCRTVAAARGRMACGCLGPPLTAAHAHTHTSETKYM